MSGLEDLIDEIEHQKAEIERLRAALEEIAKGDNHYGQLSLCEIARTALADEEKERIKAKPYSKDCEARHIPGATCQSPNCDC